MDIDITGKQIDVGDALRAHVTEALEDSIGKYTERAVDAAVIFSRDRHEFRCECSAHLSTGMKAQASGKADDIYAAFDQAETRLAKQLRRYKRRLKNHHQTRNAPVAQMAASSFVIESDDNEDDASDSLQPVIIAETQTAVQTLSVGEAVLQMELGEEPLLMFRNEKTNELSVVYRRNDGNIGWIDPSPS